MEAPRAPGSTAPLEPPGTWAPARRFALRALAPVERFLAIEAASGLVLLVAACIALAWANSPWGSSYEGLWQTSFGLHLGPWSFERDLRFWINDGLMTVFFFVVGLEIRREIHRGELSELRRAALPLFAAAGGMLVPALLFATVNHGRPSAVGWGIPMATDIAFAVGVLTLLGKRVPPALRVLLLALAVIDDVGAILVIAFFYSAGFAPAGFAVMAAGVGLVLAMQRFGVRPPLAYVAPALLVWAGAYAAGIHPTLAGVGVGLLTPARAWFGGAGFLASAKTNLESLRDKTEGDEHGLLADLDQIEGARREAVSPVVRLLHVLHGWVAFGIMPLFALANAGVTLGSASFAGDGLRVFLGVTLGLVLGKPVGVVGLSWLASRAGIVVLPKGVGWPHVAVVGLAAGIGFTMALFIAQLAFPPGPLLETAKLAILVGSTVGGLAAILVGRRMVALLPEAGVAQTEVEAETSTAG